MPGRQGRAPAPGRPRRQAGKRKLQRTWGHPGVRVEAASTGPCTKKKGGRVGPMTQRRRFSPWRVGPYVSSTLMVVALSLFFFQMAEGLMVRSATTLGHGGASVRVVAIPATQTELSGPLTPALVELATARDASIAFSPSHRSRLITVLDAHGRFQGGGQPLGADLATPGSGRTAVVSDALAPRELGDGTALLEGVTVTGTFTPEVMFELEYPTHVFNVDAAPFGVGVYLFATADEVLVDPAFTEDVFRVLAAHGLDVVDVTPGRASSIRAWLQDALASPYGVVILLFAGVVGLGLLLVLLLHARQQRERTIVEGTLGATKPHLRRLVMGRLMRQVGPGIASGVVVSGVVLVSAQDLTMAGLSSRFVGLATALAVTLMTAAVMCLAVAWREARRVGLVVPC